MKITNIAEFTEEEALDFATNEFGYQSTLTRQVEVVDETDENGVTIASHFEDEEYDNPVSINEYIAEAVERHNTQFIQGYLARKEKEAVAEVEEALEGAKAQAKAQLDARKAQVFSVTVE